MFDTERERKAFERGQSIGYGSGYRDGYRDGIVSRERALNKVMHRLETMGVDIHETEKTKCENKATF